MKHLQATLTTATAAATLLAASTVATAQDEQLQNCISLQRIDHTEVVDDQNILFYMRDDTIYQNTLPHACPGLGFEERFMYRVTIGQLCNVDLITVLEGPGLRGFRPGASCGLGKFNAVDEGMVEQLLADASSD